MSHLFRPNEIAMSSRLIMMIRIRNLSYVRLLFFSFYLSITSESYYPVAVYEQQFDVLIRNSGSSFSRNACASRYFLWVCMHFIVQIVQFHVLFFRITQRGRMCVPFLFIMKSIPTLFVCLMLSGSAASRAVRG